MSCRSQKIVVDPQGERKVVCSLSGGSSGGQRGPRPAGEAWRCLCSEQTFPRRRQRVGGWRGIFCSLNLNKNQYLMVMAWMWINTYVMRDGVGGIRIRLNLFQVSGSPLCGGGQLRHRWVLRQEQRRSLRRLDRDGPGSHKF